MFLGKRVRIISVRPPSKEAALSPLEVVDIERVEAPEPHKSGAQYLSGLSLRNGVCLIRPISHRLSLLIENFAQQFTTMGVKFRRPKANGRSCAVYPQRRSKGLSGHAVGQGQRLYPAHLGDLRV